MTGVAIGGGVITSIGAPATGIAQMKPEVSDERAHLRTWHPFAVASAVPHSAKTSDSSARHLSGHNRGTPPHVSPIVPSLRVHDCTLHDSPSAQGWAQSRAALPSDGR